jgi:hypothetical protein
MAVAAQRRGGAEARERKRHDQAVGMASELEQLLDGKAGGDEREAGADPGRSSSSGVAQCLSWLEPHGAA